MPLPTDHGQQLIDYHERTKHHLNRFARSAGYMDWDNQPAPYRTYPETRAIPLPFAKADPPLDYATLFRPAAEAPLTMDLATVATLFELSLGLSAWKAVQGHRWSLRINPSSGNLHPTEAHLIALGVAGLTDGIYHYHPLMHELEERARLPRPEAHVLASHFPPPCLLVALTSIFWREAWKYGERAFRYCHHDTGHALAALRLAARLNGWYLVCLEAADQDIATVFGLDRTAWPPGEEEAPALLAAIGPSSRQAKNRSLPSDLAGRLASLEMEGRPSRLSPQNRAWEVIRRAATAARRPPAAAQAPLMDEAAPVCHPPPPSLKAARIIRQRRSAQAFDPQGQLGREAFLSLLDRTRPRSSCPPFDAGIAPSRISLVLFVHRIEEIDPGLYAFIRHPDHLDSLRRAMSDKFRWEPVHNGLPLYLLAPGDCRAEAIDLSCRQEIAGWSTFSLGMLALFERVVRPRPWTYRELFWEAGLIGQVLYLEAEAHGVRGTGVGCYFDDPVHDHFGLKGREWQSLYHFTIGVPLEDRRVQTLPPYFHLGPERQRPDDHA
jgi:SagB-type dehydrogenase family enzyme